MIGQTLGHYHIIEKIGAGGMGIVYRAHDDRLDRDVAVKVLQANALTDETARKRFRREALTLSKLSHPNIGVIFDFNSELGVDYLVMEYIAGITLTRRLATGPLPEKEGLGLAIQIASALEEAHECSVLHRDLKPSNIIITPKGLAKVVDFGLAKLLPYGEEKDVTVSLSENAFAGTYLYASPEQLTGAALDARSDIYSLGIVLYEMATGQRPFRDPIRGRLIDAILSCPPTRPSTLNPAISSGLNTLILKTLDMDRDRRYQSARELHVDLQRLLTPSSATSATAPALRHRGSKALTSIAVLPLVNTNADPETEYVSDGMTESIINSLSHLPKLRVMARSTVFRYKDSGADPITVGRELNVGAVLTGRLVQRGDNLNISTELVDVTDGAQIWGQQYSRKLGDIFSVLGEIATEISSRLCLKLSGTERTRIAKRPTQNREAYRAYLRGRYMASKYSEEGMKKAIEFFRQAIEIDPAFALAYAGLAMTYWNVSAVQFAPNEVMPKAREAARKALEIDPQLAESHAATALVKMAYEWDRAEAEREFKHATLLNPSYATMYQWHGWHLAIMGRLEESIAELKRAQDLDPLSEINTYIGLTHYWARQYDEAAEQLQKAFELYPDFWLPHLYLGWTHLQQNNLNRAHEELGKAFRLEDSPWTVASLAHAWAISGDPARAFQLLEDLRQRAAHQFVAPYFVARIFTALSDKEQAFVWLEKAYDARDECLTWLKVDPTMDSLRKDPRFPDLLRRVGLPS
jgi:serine/threonine protein kinase/Tfp pilus assembly protein PilF